MLRKLFAVWLMVLLMAGGALAGSYTIDGLASSNGELPPSLNDLSVNPGGLGDVLVFPYYNVRNGNGVVYVRIVNTSDKAVVGKLRLREGMESEEVLDFFVCLSAHDQFTFWISDPALLGINGNTAVLVKADASVLKGDDDTVTAPSWDIAKTRTTTSAGKAIDDERTFEGYIEFFGLSSVDETAYEEIMESATDKALACADLGARETNINGISVNYYDVPNALVGEAYLFNFKGDYIQTYAYKAIAIANYKDSAITADLSQDSPLFNGADAGLIGVNYVLTKSKFYVFYDLQNYLLGKTDVILNFVTKKENIDQGRMNYYIDKDSEHTCSQGNYTYCCVQVNTVKYDDEENTPASGIDFSPVPPGRTASLCYEVSYMPVGSGPGVDPIFDTGLKELSLDTNYELGWAEVDFTGNANAKTSIYITSENATYTAFGQPVLIYQVQSYFNGLLSHMLPVAYEVEATKE